VSISTFAELKTNIADFLNRDDLTSAIPTFIALAEAQINRDLRHWKMQSRTSFTIDSEFEDLPADWLETISLNAGNKYPLKLASRETIADKRMGNEDTAGTPEYYAHIADKFEFYPTPDDTYTGDLLYFQKVPALSDSNTTNWLLSHSPDVYLYGSLIHTAAYLQEDARAGTWAQLYGAAVQKLNLSSDSATMSGSGLVMKNRGLG